MCILYITSGLVMFIGLLSNFQLAEADKECIPRRYNHSSIVCVCNSTYCDTIDKIVKLPELHFVTYTSSMDGLRFKRYTGMMGNLENLENEAGVGFPFLSFFTSEERVILEIYKDKQQQKVYGFGGAFTDASGINLSKLSKNLQNKLIEAYFADDGLEFNLCRVPIGGTDFSSHGYTYNMEPKDDINLSNFHLAPEDFLYKIPYIQQAMKVSQQKIFLIASAWSPPIWMKTNNKLYGVSRLFLKYFQTYADFHVKFLEEYEKHNITFWGITTGNEPTTGIMNIVPLNSLGWLPPIQLQWITDNLGPTLRKSRFKDIKLIAVDDYKIFLHWWFYALDENGKALDYLDGIGTHWYLNNFTVEQENTHDLFPNLFVMATEACVGFEPWFKERVQLGSWRRCEGYMSTLIVDMNNWYTGWIDWNFILDEKGGPNWLNNFVDAPIIGFPEKDEFVKQPIFYFLGHISKFIPRDSIKVESYLHTGNIENMAFLRPDGGVTVILFNPSNKPKNVAIKEYEKGYFNVYVPSRAIVSVVYW